MAKAPDVSSISKDTLGDAPDWVGLLLRPLNAFLGATRAALANGLTVGENLAGEWKRVPVTGGSLPDAFSLEKLAGRPYAVLLGGVALRAGSAPSAAVGFTWEAASIPLPSGKSKPGVRLTSLAGLTAGSQYTLTLLILAE